MTGPDETSRALRRPFAAATIRGSMEAGPACAMASPPSSGSQQPGVPSAGAPLLLVGVPLTISTMLLVLFAVVVNRQQEQAQQLAQLQQRVQALENSRAIERTSVLEEQMRTMLTRLQAMEKGGQLLQSLERQQLLLQQDLQQLRANLIGHPRDSLEPALEATPGPRAARPAPAVPRQPRLPVPAPQEP